MTRKIMVVAFLCLSLGMKAQQESGSWTLTPRVGVNSSNVAVEDLWVMPDKAFSAKRKWGFVGGFDAEYQAWQQVGISVGVFYSNEGYTYGDIPDMGRVTQTLHYLNIPVLANFYIEPNILPGLALKAGFQLGYLMKAKMKDGLGNYSRGDNISDYKHINISIPAGISYSYKNFVADLRYNIGVMNICNTQLEIDDSWKTNSLWFTLGYQFRLR
ncbi:MAG: PorT family protein [Prevotella sp.]|nr:PorT family protein [Prevotella sp.]